LEPAARILRLRLATNDGQPLLLLSLRLWRPLLLWSLLLRRQPL